jgi:inhibitor of cysteine peptidase
LKRIIFNLCIIVAIVWYLNVYAADKSDNIYTENQLDIVVSPKHAEFTLKIKSNPSTGYTWFLHAYDNYLIVPLKHRFEPANSKVLGASSYEFWTFKVKPIAFSVPQYTNFRMIYARPWKSSDDSTELVFTIFTQDK